MSITLRPYQLEAVQRIRAAWAAGYRRPLLVLPTGAGKTVAFADILRGHLGASCAIAHRRELVGQIALALARAHVRHRIIGPRRVVEEAVSLQVLELGQSHYDPGALCGVAGVDTLVQRADKLGSWLRSVSLWVMDEAHHVLQGNKWGRAVALFPNAIGLGVTATPLRADGHGLGSHAVGVFDALIVGPAMRELITARYLTDYRIFAPRTADLDLSEVPVSASTGDFTTPKLVTAIRNSRIVGDVVEQYVKLARGRRGATFVTDVQTAQDVADRFNAEGIPAEAVWADTPDTQRFRAKQKLERGELLQLVNVDLFGEGFDLPAIDCVSFSRPTQSYGLYVQQFGRPLRPSACGVDAIIIDHVGNVLRHGLPDAPQTWSLDSRDRRPRGESEEPIGLRACPSCTGVYERVLLACPYCWHRPVPGARSTPQQVEGDLFELDADALATLRKAVAHVDTPAECYADSLRSRGCPEIGVAANTKRHREHQSAQVELRDAIAWWAGHQRAWGREDSESYRQFFLSFGVDVLSAQALGAQQATELAHRVRADYERRSA
jgi:superfamily II DNA or RNA helicase